MDTIVFCSLIGLMGLFMAATIVARGRSRGQSPLKSLDENIAVFPGCLLPAILLCFRSSMLARVLVFAAVVLISVRLVFRNRHSADR